MNGARHRNPSAADDNLSDIYNPEKSVRNMRGLESFAVDG